MHRTIAAVAIVVAVAAFAVRSASLGPFEEPLLLLSMGTLFLLFGKLLSPHGQPSQQAADLDEPEADEPEADEPAPHLVQHREVRP